MRADPRFLVQPKAFWANVRTISQEIGYTSRKTGQVRVYSIAEMAAAMTEVGLGVKHLTGRGGTTELGRALEEYFESMAPMDRSFGELWPKVVDLDRTPF